MRNSLPFWATVALTFTACGGEVSEVPHAPSRQVASSQARLGGRFLRNANPVRGQYIVVMKADAASSQGLPEVASELSGRYRGQLHRTFQHALRAFVVRMSESDALALSLEPDVSFVEEDGWSFLDVDDPDQAHDTHLAGAESIQANPSWGLDRVEQFTLPLDGAYQYHATGSWVNAYIIDSGIRDTHADLLGRVSLSYSSVQDGNGASDCNGHGTHVAATLGGSTHGVAKQVQLHSVRVFGCSGGTPTSDVLAAVDWVTANHVKPAVVNMSLAGSPNQALDEAVRNSIALGLVYVVAAGNNGDSACNYSPARTPEALTVGATDTTDTRASYSNHGSCLDLFAPGSDIVSAWWDSDTSTSSMSGTSMAAPHVAGAAALFLEKNPNATPAQVSSALTSNATLNRVVDAGTGSPNRLLYTSFIDARICKGQTTPGATAWVQFNTDGIYVDVNTSACGFSSTPLYFASLGGGSTHWAIKGVTSIYMPTPTGFRVYINQAGITTTEANQRNWHLNWQAVPNKYRQANACTGQTTAGSTAWKQHNADGIYVDVNTSGCGFSSTPLYFTSIGGGSYYWQTMGATSIYSPTATGFRVYINKAGVTPAYANERNWHINWQAMPNSLRQADVCTGRTTPGSTAWAQHNADGIYVDVNTSGCGITSTPRYFTSIGGSTHHWQTMGATSIYSPTATGFRVYINQAGITPTEANQKQWHINWSRR